MHKIIKKHAESVDYYTDMLYNDGNHLARINKLYSESEGIL